MIWMIRGCERSFDQSRKSRLKYWKFVTVLGSPVTDLQTVVGPYVLHVC